MSRPSSLPLHRTLARREGDPPIRVIRPDVAVLECRGIPAGNHPIRGDAAESARAQDGQGGTGQSSEQAALITPRPTATPLCPGDSDLSGGGRASSGGSPPCWSSPRPGCWPPSVAGAFIHGKGLGRAPGSRGTAPRWGSSSAGPPSVGRPSLPRIEPRPRPSPDLRNGPGPSGSPLLGPAGHRPGPERRAWLTLATTGIDALDSLLRPLPPPAAAGGGRACGGRRRRRRERTGSRRSSSLSRYRSSRSSWSSVGALDRGNEPSASSELAPAPCRPLPRRRSAGLPHPEGASGGSKAQARGHP